MRTGNVQRKIEEILENHEQDEKQLIRQLQEARMALEADLDAMREQLLLHGIDYSLDRVISSQSHDAKLLNVLQAMDERRDLYETRVSRIQKRLDEIAQVYELVLDLDPRLRTVVMALYYPRRTYSAAADEIGIDVRTISRRRTEAVDELVREAEIHEIF